jgi:hypothetical protein
MEEMLRIIFKDLDEDRKKTQVINLYMKKAEDRLCQIEYAVGL